MKSKEWTARFRLGEIIGTERAIKALKAEDILMGIWRHQSGDWSKLASRDRAANEQALVDGTRIFTSYVTVDGVKFWLITEADRSRTTIMLPEEY